MQEKNLGVLNVSDVGPEAISLLLEEEGTLILGHPSIGIDVIEIDYPKLNLSFFADLSLLHKFF